MRTAGFVPHGPGAPLVLQEPCAARLGNVSSRWHTYRIRLGSGNILMEDGCYPCIVLAGMDANASDAFLPFEGGRMLSLILSNAFMLALDEKITEPHTASQLRR